MVVEDIFPGVRVINDLLPGNSNLKTGNLDRGMGFFVPISRSSHVPIPSTLIPEDRKSGVSGDGGESNYT